MEMLPYYEVHEGNGPPLLLVHGFLSSRAQWQPNLEALKTECSPVVVELYGHGRSPAPTEPAAYHPDGYIAVFEEIRERLCVSRWFVCGYSLGAGLTIRYSIERPDVVIAQMFTNSTSAFAAGNRYLDEPDEVIRRFEEGGKQAIESIPVHPKFARRLPEGLKRALLEDCEMLSPSGVARTIVYTNGNSSVRDLVERNRVPALLICGRNETRFEEFRRHVSTHMPCLEIVDLPAGHAVNAEAAGEFNRAALEFLSRHDD